MHLPTGWIDCTLGDVAHIGGFQQVAPSDIPKDAWVLELEDVERDTSRVLQVRTAAERALKSSKNAFAAGDVLFSRLRPNLNKVVLAEGPGYCTTEMVPLRPKHGLDSNFLFWWLQHSIFRRYAVDKSHGLNMPRLGSKPLRDAPFRLAPIEHQHQTVAALRRTQNHLYKLKTQLGSIPGRIKLLRAAVLDSAVRGLLTADWRFDRDKEAPNGLSGRSFQENGFEVIRSLARTSSTGGDSMQIAGSASLFEIPDTWSWIIASELVDPEADIVYGIVQPGPQVSEGVPYIRGMDIVDGVIQIDQLYKTDPAIARRYSRSQLAPGDVLLGIIRATKVAIVPPELQGANITQGTARLRPSSLILSEFLAIALESPPLQGWLHSHYRGIDMPGLNLSDVRSLPIPVPSRTEQEQIVDRVRTLLTLSQGFEAQLDEALDNTNACSKILLSKAFSAGFATNLPFEVSGNKLLEQMKTDVPPVRLKKTKSRIKANADGSFRSEVRNVIQKLKKTRFTVEDILDVMPEDYETIRRELFVLLRMNPPILKQAFNEKSRIIEFVRTAE